MDTQHLPERHLTRAEQREHPPGMLTGLVIVWVLCAIGAGMFAHYKQRDVGPFVLAGFLLGPIGLIWAAFATPEMPRAAQRRTDEINRALNHSDKLRDAGGMHWPEG